MRRNCCLIIDSLKIRSVHPSAKVKKEVPPVTSWHLQVGFRRILVMIYCNEQVLNKAIVVEEKPQPRDAFS